MSLLYQAPHGQPSSDRHPCAPLLHVTLKDLGGLGKKAAIQQSKAIMAAVVAKLPRQVQAAAVDLDCMSEDMSMQEQRCLGQGGTLASRRHLSRWPLNS